MNDSERLDSIRRKFGSSGAAGLESDDVEFLLSLAERQAAKTAELEKKNSVLSRHVLELTEEMENVRMDFGGGNR